MAVFEQCFSHSANPQVLSTNPPCLQNQYHVGDSCTIFDKFCCQLDVRLCVPSLAQSQLLCTDPKDILPYGKWRQSIVNV